RSNRRGHRLEAPAAHGVDRFAIEHAGRVRTHHARGGDGAVGTDRVLDQHRTGLAGAQGLRRELRRRHRDRTQVRRARCRGRGRRGTLLGGAAVGCNLVGSGLVGGSLVGGGLVRGGLVGGLVRSGLLRRQFLRGLFLLLLLVGQALVFERLLALGFFFRGQGLRALGGGGLLGGDAGLEAGERRVLRIGLLEQGRQAVGFAEVVAIDALLDRDDGHRQQVGQRAGDSGVGLGLVAQGEVVLDGVVAGRRVQAVLGIGLAGGFAQLVGGHGGDLRRHRGGRCRRRGGGWRGGGGGGLLGGLVLAARGEHETGGEHGNELERGGPAHRPGLGMVRNHVFKSPGVRRIKVRTAQVTPAP